MAFVNEDIPKADQQRLNYSNLKDPQTGSGISDSPRWTVDHERDAFLMHLGGGMDREDYHVPHYFLFSWKDAWIRVDAFQRRRASDDPMLATLTWEVIRLSSPDAVPAPQEEGLQILAEAFIAFGNTGTQWAYVNIKDVHVEFPAQRSIERLTGSRAQVFYKKTYPNKGE